MGVASAFMVSVFALYAFAGEVAVTFCDDAIVRVERFPNDPRPDAGSLAVVLRPQGVAAERSESAAERTWRAKDMPKIWKFEALQDRPRLFVLTDLANEPDDEESLVRLLAYANEFDIEGIVATTSCPRCLRASATRFGNCGEKQCFAWVHHPEAAWRVRSRNML